MDASPLGCRGRGLSKDSGREAGSTRRGEACWAVGNEVGRGEGRSELRFLEVALTGIPDVCERKAEKEGTKICAREFGFFTAA